SIHIENEVIFIYIIKTLILKSIFKAGSLGGEVIKPVPASCIYQRGGLQLLQGFGYWIFSRLIGDFTYVVRPAWHNGIDHPGCFFAFLYLVFHIVFKKAFIVHFVIHKLCGMPIVH